MMVLIGGGFCFILYYLIYGCYKPKSQFVDSVEELTVLIPFKNEMAILPEKVRRLKSQLEKNPDITVWLLNDHSSDLGDFNRHRLETNEQIILKNIPASVDGKKAAVSYGIQQARTEWILVMDADADLAPGILSPKAKIIPSGAKCILIPLAPEKRKGRIPAFFGLAFLSLHVAGLASANYNLPLLANCACMLVSREAYIDTMEQRTDWLEPSGDDVFLMFAIAKKYGRNAVKVLDFFKSPAQVYFPTQFKKLWHQRLRWISKTGQIKNTWFQIVSGTVLLTQISLIVNGFIIMKSPVSDMILIITTTIFLTEIVYLAIASARLHRKDLWMFIIPAVFIYPFYLLSLLIFSIFAKS